MMDNTDMTKKKTASVINISSIKAACKDCSLQHLCLPLGLDNGDMASLDGIIKRRRPLRRGEYLYRMGDPLQVIYAIRSGTFKSSELLSDGRIQLTGFHLPGELLGVDAIGTETHPCNAEALDDAEVCEIPYTKLEELARVIPGLQHQFLRIMSNEIAREQGMLMMIGKMTAEERLATCLLNFSRRQEALGYSPTRLRLPMSRQDIGDYLGLALETVSRLFSRFQEDGHITVHGKQVELHDIAALEGKLAFTSHPFMPRDEGQVTS
jgi:CRP/FNR family transcriptional regulator